MTEPNAPPGYQPPPMPKRTNTGANFGLGVLIGLAASGIAGGIAYASQSGNVIMIALGVLLVGKIGVAAYLGATGRRPGFGPGLLVSIALVALILGGLCFAALKNI